MKRLLLFLKKYFWPFKHGESAVLDNRTFWQKTHEKVTKMLRYYAGERRLPGGFQNMPKSQYCSECHTTSRRVKKTERGAWYHCRNHGDFFGAI